MKQKRFNTFGSAQHGVFINSELRQSEAYRTLTAAARLVLIDWLGKYMQKSRGDTVRLTGGMSYSLGDCSEVLSRGTFIAARAEIIKRGFFEEPPDLQTLTPGSRNLYMPSSKWRRYQPTPEEQNALQRAAKSRKSALERWSRYRQKQETAKAAREGSSHD